MNSKQPSYQCRRCGFNPWVGKIPWRRKWQPPPVFLPGESHGQRSLEGYSPWGHKESDTAERLNHRHHRGHLWRGFEYKVWPLICVFCKLKTLIPRSHMSDPARPLLVPNQTRKQTVGGPWQLWTFLHEFLER